MGNKNSGNPNILIDTAGKQTGAKTKEGKLKTLVRQGLIKSTTKSRLLNKFKNCNICPLRPRIEKRIIDNNEKSFSFPSKCTNYRLDGKCLIDQGEMIAKLDYYYRVGEEQDSIALQNALTYSILENAEISKQNEIMKSRQPGFYTAKFQEIAVDNLTNLNKIKYGERLTTQNLNVNIDLTDALIEAYKKRKEVDKEKGEGDESS